MKNFLLVFGGVLSAVVFPNTACAGMIDDNAVLAGYSNVIRNANKPPETVDSVTPGVMARTMVDKIVLDNLNNIGNLGDVGAERQADGSYKLTSSNSIIRTSYSDVTNSISGGIRVASPVINGNVSGTVLLWVEGKPPENVNIINTPK